MTVARLLIIMLAAYRLTRLAVKDEITERPRRWITSPTRPIGRWAGSLLSCYWCAGFWTAAGVVALAEWLPDSTILPILTIFAASTVVGFLSRLEDDE